jgi:hypothetical protein
MGNHAEYGCPKIYILEKEKTNSRNLFLVIIQKYKSPPFLLF